MRRSRTSCRFSARFRKLELGVWLFFSSLRIAHGGNAIAQPVHLAWIFWFALLFVSAIATVVYSAYRHAKLIEFSTGGHLLLGHENAVWREVAGFLEHAGHEECTAA